MSKASEWARKYGGVVAERPESFHPADSTLQAEVASDGTCRFWIDGIQRYVSAATMAELCTWGVAVFGEAASQAAPDAAPPPDPAPGAPVGRLVFPRMPSTPRPCDRCHRPSRDLFFLEINNLGQSIVLCRACTRDLERDVRWALCARSEPTP